MRISARWIRAGVLGRRARGRYRGCVWLLALVAAQASGCASTDTRIYSPLEVREELQRRLPDVPASEIVVPFEVDPPSIERARTTVAQARNPEERTRALVEALSAPEGFALTYRWAENNSAALTLAARGGNCLGLSSVLVGLARALGMRAYYIDATIDPERRQEESLRVAAGHIAVVVVSSTGPLFVDFTGELQRGWRYRRIGDLEAAAHYYNNLGYELIHRATEAGEEIPWQEVQRQFARATRIAPGLATAWNNVGVAAARLGRPDQAERSYRRAVALDPDLDSAQENLAALRTSSDPTLTHADAAVDRQLDGQRAGAGARPALVGDPAPPSADRSATRKSLAP